MADSDSLKKDWITTVIATSAILLPIVVGVIAFAHSALEDFWWPIILVDVLGLAAVVSFLFAARGGLDALGSLILASSEAEKGAAENAQAAQTKTRRSAMSADGWFRAGLILTLAVGATAAIVLNWDAAMNDSGSNGQMSDDASSERRIECSRNKDEQ